MWHVLRVILALVICVVLMSGGLIAVPAHADAPCARADSLRCKVCQLLQTTGCTEEPQARCPTKTSDYSDRFQQLEDKLKERKARLEDWTKLRRELSKLSPADLCKVQLDKIKRAEAAIPGAGSCAGAPGDAAQPAATENADIEELTRFRQCASAKSKELGIQAKRRARNDESADFLGKLQDESSRITAKSVDLMHEFWELRDGTKQAKCWLLDQIQLCQKYF